MPQTNRYIVCAGLVGNGGAGWVAIIALLSAK